MRYFTFYILFIFCFLNQAEAQSWRKLSKMASQLAKNGQYAEAAEKYEAAWKEKNSKTEFIEKAGEYYALVRDYKRATEAYRNLKDNPKIPFAKYYFARSLKQDGQYTDASREFSEFITIYKGKDKESLTSVIENEIKGCELAQQMIKNGTKNTTQFSRISSLVNSSEAEFAPVPFADDILYFSSTISGKAVIYRSQKSNGSWNKAALANGIPVSNDKNICNGSFSSDGKRFYFTICGTDEENKLVAKCKIYVITKNQNSWSEPIKLNDNINASGANVSQPFVTQFGEKEVLYFSSDASGGSGNMDIWQSSRNALSDNLAFSSATNLGANVNTPGDDITPYYDAAESTLYFSSNAQISIGGHDIFKSKNNNNVWSKAENIGLPYNSNADDYYFTKNKSKNGGFLVSNRIYGKEKTVTTNEDIFEFSNPSKPLVINGKVLQKANSVPLKDVRVTLYEVMSNTQKRLLQTKMIGETDYEFALLLDKKYRLETEKKGFKNTFYEFGTSKNDSTSNGISYNIYVENQEKPSDVTVKPYIEDPSKPTTNTPKQNTDVVKNTKTNVPKSSGTKSNPTTTSSSNTPNSNSAANSTTATPQQPTKNNNEKTVEKTIEKTPTKTTETAATNKPTPTDLPKNTTGSSDIFTAKGGTSVGNMPLYEMISATNERLLTSAPKQTGTYYKIQIVATRDFSYEDSKYRPIRDFGRMDTEYIIGKNVNRVLLADFFAYEDAEKLLPQVQQNREFKTAYIVKYENGIRIGNAK
jgi:hypothetical protein